MVGRDSASFTQLKQLVFAVDRGGCANSVCVVGSGEMRSGGTWCRDAGGSFSGSCHCSGPAGCSSEVQGSGGGSVFDGGVTVPRNGSRHVSRIWHLNWGAGGSPGSMWHCAGKLLSHFEGGRAGGTSVIACDMAASTRGLRGETGAWGAS